MTSLEKLRTVKPIDAPADGTDIASVPSALEKLRAVKPIDAPSELPPAGPSVEATALDRLHSVTPIDSPDLSGFDPSNIFKSRYGSDKVKTKDIASSSLAGWSDYYSPNFEKWEESRLAESVRKPSGYGILGLANDSENKARTKAVSEIRPADTTNAESYSAEVQKWLATIRPEPLIERELERVDAALSDAKKNESAAVPRGTGDVYLTGKSYYLNKAKEYTAEIEELEKKKALLEEERAWRKYIDYSALADKEDFESISQYAPTGLALDESFFKTYETQKLDTDKYLYEFVNAPEEVKKEFAERVAILGTPISFSALATMTPSEVSMYNYILATEGKGPATEYLEFLDATIEKTGATDLERRRRLNVEEEARAFAKEHPVLASVQSVAMAPLKALSPIGQLVDYVTTGEIDSDKAYNDVNRISSAVRSQVSENINDPIGRFFYNTGMSIADFATTLAVSAGSGNIALAIMGAGSAGDTVVEARDRGLSSDQAFAVGVAAGAAEVVMERLGLDSLFKGDWTREGLRFMLKQGLTEAGEEAGTNLINTLADVLISQDKSEWQTAVDRYKEKGLSTEEAFGKALGDKALEMGIDALSGFVSGMTTSTGKGIGQTVTNKTDLNRLGTLIKNSDKVRNELLSRASSAPTTSEAYRIGEQIQKKMAYAENVTARELAELYVAVNREVSTVSEDNANATKNDANATPTVSVDNSSTSPVIAEPTTTFDPAADTVREQLARDERAGRLATNDTEDTGYRLGVAEDIIKRVSELGQRLDRKIVFDADPDIQREGWLDRNTGTIHLNAQAATFEDAYRGILMHELTHSIENSQLYSELSAAILSHISRTDSDAYRAKLQSFKDLYKKKGITLNDIEAQKEVVADYVRRDLFTDEASITHLCTEDPSLGSRLKYQIDRFIAWLGEKLGNSDTAARERAYLYRVSDMYARALRSTPSASFSSSADTIDRDVEEGFEGAQKNTAEGGVENSYKANSYALPSFDTSESVSDQTAKEDAASFFNSLPKEVRDHVEFKERSVRRTFAKVFGLPTNRRTATNEAVRAVEREYLSTGTVSDATISRLFEDLYKTAVTESAAYVDAYKDVNDYLNGVSIEVDQETFNANRNLVELLERMGYGVTVYENAGIPLETVWNIISQKAPALFPTRFKSGTRRIRLIADHLIDYSNANRFSREAKSTDAFEKSMMRAERFRDEVLRFASGLSQSRRYLLDRGNVSGVVPTEADITDGDNKADDTILPTNAEELKKLYEEKKRTREVYEKARREYVLTPSDIKKMAKLITGEITFADLDPSVDNVEALQVLVPLKKDYEAFAKPLRLWNKKRREDLDILARSLLGPTISAYKDKSIGLAYARETAERNIRDISPDEKTAQRIIDTYIKPIYKANADMVRFKDEYISRVAALGLSDKVAKGNTNSEAAIVQMLGEALDSVDFSGAEKYTSESRDGLSRAQRREFIAEMWKENPNVDRAKIQKAVTEFRRIYDEFFTRMNDVRVLNGYEPVSYRRGYFPHFRDNDIQSFAAALGFDLSSDVLPTAINGMTSTFKPGAAWFKNAQKRYGDETDFDALEGFERYLNGVSDVIYHTDNIQRLRSLERTIRRMSTELAADAGDAVAKDAIERNDLLAQDPARTDDEIEAPLKAATDRKDKNGSQKYALSNFVVWLSEYTNGIANKKSYLDRGAEMIAGRRFYDIIDKTMSKTGLNVVGGNISSALSNFVPLASATAYFGPSQMLRGAIKTVINLRDGKNDGFVGKSDFLTSRFGSEKVHQTGLEKWQEFIGIPMDFVDRLVAESIVRARYDQNVRKGLSDAASMEEADAFARGIMAGRSKGEQPILFNSRTLKAITQFQLEVNNQFSELAKDLKRDAKGNVAKYVGMLLRYAVSAYFLNDLIELITGRRPALDPVDILNDFVGDRVGAKLKHTPDILMGIFDGELSREDLFDTVALNEEQNYFERALSSYGKLGESVSGQLPFVSGFFGGGRIPAATSIPDLASTAQTLSDPDKSAGAKISGVIDDVVLPLAYGLFPVGGLNQAQKSVKGAIAIAQGGSYKENGDGKAILQYPAYRDEGVGTALRGAQALVFGKSALPGAVDWANAGFASLSAKETEAYKNMLDSGAGERESYELIKSLGSLNKAREKRDALRESQISDSAKMSAYYGLLASDDEKETLDLLSDPSAVNVILEIKNAESNSKKAQLIGASKFDPSDKALLFEEYVSGDREIDGEIKRGSYGRLIDAGLPDHVAANMAVAMASLEPIEGNKVVTSVQKQNAIATSGYTQKQIRDALLTTVSGDETSKSSQRFRLELCYDSDIPFDVYTNVKLNIKKYDKNGNGNYSGSEYKDAIDALYPTAASAVIPGSTRTTLTRREKAILWQILTGSTSTESNPYGSAGSSEIARAFKKKKEE